MKIKDVLFWLTAGYVGGSLISSSYNKKTGDSYKKDLSNSENSFKYVLDNFLEMHKNLFLDIKKELTTEKNVKIYKEYKKRILDIFDEYKEKSEVFLLNLKEKGSSYLGETVDNLKNLYEKEIKDLDDLKGLSKDKIEELKEKLTKSFEKTKKDLKKIVEK